MVEILQKEVAMDFDKAVDHVQKIIMEEDFTVLLTKAIDEVIKEKLGLQKYPRYSIILACGADLAKMALNVSKNVGTLFPCSFVVYEEEGLIDKVIVAHVSIMKIAAELNLASPEKMIPVIERTGERVQRVWQKI